MKEAKEWRGIGGGRREGRTGVVEGGERDGEELYNIIKLWFTLYLKWSII